MHNHPSYNHYLDYQLIPPNDYRRKIKYFERHFNVLQYLDDSEKLDLYLNFSKALFEVGNYHRYILFVDPLIEQVIKDNVYLYQGEKIYEHLLFRKSAALFHTKKIDHSIRILKSLVKIDKDHQIAKRLLKLCIRKKAEAKYDWTKAIAILFLFSACSVLFAELIIATSYYDYVYLHGLIAIRSSLIILALMVMVGRELAIHRYINIELQT